MRSYIVRYMYSIITGGNLTMNSTTTNDNLKKWSVLLFLQH